MTTSASTDAFMRVCECRPGEVADALDTSNSRAGGEGGPTPVPLGAVVSSRWDPTHPRRLGVLYSSGTLRLWDVVTDEKRDFALYIPAAGLPLSGGGHGGGGVADRRAAMPITQFAFLPLHTPTPLPRIAFTLRHQRRCYVADLPLPPPAPGVTLDHFLSGSRVYALPTPLPSEVTCMTAWLVSPLPPTPTVALVVGCNDGGLCAWLISGAFNPEAVVSMRSKRFASPGWLWAGPGAADDSAGSVARASATAARRSTRAAPRHQPASVMGHGGQRVRCVQGLQVAPHDAWAAALRQAGTIDAGVGGGGGGDRYEQRHRGVPCNTLLLSSGDDGAITLWRLQLSPSPSHSHASSTPFTHPFLVEWDGPAGDDGIPLPPASRFTLALIKVCDLPTDGVPTTAISTCAWPLATTTPQGSQLLSLESVMLMRARKAPDLHLGGRGAINHAASNGGWGGSHPLPTHRVMIATGNKEGVVTLWEMLVDGWLTSMTAGAAHTAASAPGAAGVGGVRGEFVAHATAETLMRVANGGSRLGSGMPAIPVPTVRLVGLLHARSLDPVADVAISPPFTSPDEPYKLAVAGVDGTLQMYHLGGSTGLDGDGLDAHSPGSGGPILVRMAGSVGDVHAAATTAYDMIQHLGLEAAALRRLAAVGIGGNGGRGRRASGSGATHGGEDEDEDDTPSVITVPMEGGAPEAGDAHIRVTRALTVAALAGLRRAYVSCAFNDAARWYSDHVGHGDGGEEEGEPITTAALMACNGGGDVMLWPRTALPGDVPEPGGGDGTVEERWAEAAEGTGIPPPSPQVVGDMPPPPTSANDARAMATAAAAAVLRASGESPPPPAAALPMHGAGEGGDDGHGMEEEAEDEAPPQPRPPLHRVIEADGAHVSAPVVVPVHEALDTVPPATHDDDEEGGSLGGAVVADGGASVAGSHVMNDTVASRCRKMAIAEGMGKSDKDGSGVEGVVVPSHATPSRSPSLPVSRIKLRQLRTAAEDAVRGVWHGGSKAGVAGHALSHAQRFHPSTGSSPISTHATPVDRWLARTTAALHRNEHAADAAVSAAVVDGRSEGWGMDPASGGGSRAAVNMTTDTDPTGNLLSTTHVTAATHGGSVTGSRSRGRRASGAGSVGGHSSASGRGLTPTLRNPAKVAAVLRREAAEDTRTAILVARESTGSVSGRSVDGHPDAAAMYARVGMASGGHHLVAPALGSSSAVAAEIARLTSATFDRCAEVRGVLRDMGIHDPGTVRAVWERVAPDAVNTTVASAGSVSGSRKPGSRGRRGLGEQHGPGEEDEEVVYAPRERGSGARSLVPPSQPAASAALDAHPRKEARPPSASLMRPTASRLAAARGSSHVSAADIAALHLKGFR